MGSILPNSVNLAVEAFRCLPGVGQRSAERYVYALLRANQADSQTLAKALGGLHQGLGYCQKTFALVGADQEVSDLYNADDRDKSQVLVVASPFDVLTIERLGTFTGTYHVLGGLLSPIDGIGPEQLHIEELKERVVADNVKEVIFGFSASVEGESTALLIQKSLPGLKVSRLAQGLPIGVDLEYADELTLSRALANRQKLA